MALPGNTTHVDNTVNVNRRRFIGYFSSVGLCGTLLPGALAAVARDAEDVTTGMIKSAASIAGLDFSGEEIEQITSSINKWDNNDSYDRIREFELDNSVAPAIVFNPVPVGVKLPSEKKLLHYSNPRIRKPETDEDIAFLSVTHLSHLIRTRQITSTELTKLYLSRLKKFSPKLFCLITLTEDLALRQAKLADEEIAAGTYRGPLHGIPWGGKDLLAVRGYKTTWGASPYREQSFSENSTVYERLTDAGAVLVGKLSMGALAMDNRWFGGKTRNPWNTGQSSSGSSAGSGSATAAGLVGFSIGTETLGSIISPSSRCGVSGLRPSFGRVSRFGAMALSWSMDKIGPMCRSAEDCALVLDTIYGPDGKDNSVIDVPFNWDSATSVGSLRVGYFTQDDRETPDNPEEEQRIREAQERDAAAFEVITSLGVQLIPLELPEFPAEALEFILFVESAAAFDDLMRSGRDKTMLEEPETSEWPQSFRSSRFIPAVEYVQANRVRTKIIGELYDAMAGIDCFIGSRLVLSNLTGYPEISIPHGFYTDGTPTSLLFTGKLFGEAEILLLAKAFQDATDHHLKYPKL